MDNELEAVKKDYMVFTTIEQQLMDGLMAKWPDKVTTADVWEIHKNSVQDVLKVIEQHKADLYKKYPL